MFGSNASVTSLNPLSGSDNTVKLPFPVLNLYWHNGNQMAPREGAKYFGGWEAGAEDIVADMALLGLDQLPAGFIGPETWVNREGKEYDVYSSRMVLAAPITSRMKWYEKEYNGVKKSRSTFSVLCYLATTDNNAYTPWGLAVLSASGMAGVELRNTFGNSMREAAKGLRSSNIAYPAEFFYHPIGTFGPQRITKTVGKQGASSPIVPPQYPQLEWNKATAEKHFVGDVVMAIMTTSAGEAQDWVLDAANKDADF
jgi:hypothetical protein